MRRPLAHLSEIARRADDSFAEVPLPDAVRHDARRQRIRRAREPARQLRAAASVRNWRLTVTRQDHREPLRRWLSLILRITADQHSLLGHFALRDRAGERRLRRPR